MMMTLTASDPPEAIAILHRSPNVLAGNLWVTGFYALASAGLSMLCIGFVQLRTAHHSYDSKKNLIISTGAVTAAVGLAMLLISTLAVESWGTVAGIILLVWFTVLGFALSKGWVHTAPGTEPQHLETPGSIPAN